MGEFDAIVWGVRLFTNIFLTAGSVLVLIGILCILLNLDYDTINVSQLVDKLISYLLVGCMALATLITMITHIWPTWG